MIDEVRLKKFYADVPADYLSRFRQFLRTHANRTIAARGEEITYCSSGQGNKTLVTFCGGHSAPYTVWETFMAFESDCRVIAIDISGCDTVDGLVKSIDRVLDSEDAGQVILLGTSLAGLISQVYFTYRSDRVDGLMLMNTLALRPGRGSHVSVMVMKLIPGSVLKFLFRAKFRSYYRMASKHPRAENGRRFGLAHLDDIMANHFTKEKVINLLKVIGQFGGRKGERGNDFLDWRGRTLVVASEDDEGFKDARWLVDNLPNTEFHALPRGLGHLPQLVHRERIDALIRTLLTA